jgi:hypothetical protein
VGVSRFEYKVAPGLYCIGKPDADSPVLVTANYKLSVDVLRRELKDLDGWILVVDARGINVWCAAGKKTFSTEEVVQRVKRSGLDQVVTHRKLILPQLSATGVSAQQVKKGCGFEVVWGPVRANDIKPFLDNGMKAEPEMRQVTFSFQEISGAVLAPAFLPWIPTRAFALKGSITGLITGAGIVWLFWDQVGGWGALGLVFCTMAISSYMAMNFTGSTPFTSMSGVEKEMRKAIPLQMIAGLLAVVVWVGSAFAR